jgi:hypothetical protein
MKFGVSPGKYSISDQKSESFYKVSWYSSFPSQLFV